MAAPVDAGSIYSDVRIRLDKLTSDIKAVNTGFDKMGKNIRENSDETTKTQTKNFKQVGLAGVAAIGAITLAFKKSISVFAATEQSLANVEAVSNATAAEFRELEKAASDAGTTTRFTAGQAADALFFLSSAGLSATESVKALDGVLLLAGATGSDLAFSAQAITSTLSQFGLAADKAADVSNIFAAANSNSQATLDKLASSLRQAGPVAASLGIGLEEVVGSLQALFNAGFKGEQAGTALRNALADLANESSPTIEKLNALGVSFEQVNPEAVGLTGAIGALADAGLSTGEVIEAFGKEVGPQLLTLIKVGREGLEDYTDAVTGTSEAARQYAVQNDTLSGSIDALKSAVEGTSNSFIETLAPIFRAVIDIVAGLLRVINKLPDLLKGAGAGAGVAAGGFIALSKALALIGVTLSTGPLAIVAGIAALGVGLTVLVKKAQEAKDIRLAEEFGDLARELGFAGQAVDDFTEKAGKIERAFQFLEAGGIDFDSLQANIAGIAREFELTEDQVIAVAKASDSVSDIFKEQLAELQKQAVELQIINELSDKNLIIQEKIELRRLAQVSAAREEARIAAEVAEKEREREKNAERLEAIKNRLITLDELALSGALKEQEAIEEKKSLREEEIQLLLEQAITSGEVTDQIVADIAIQQEAIDRYELRLLAIDEEKELLSDKDEERTIRTTQEFLDSLQIQKDAHDQFLAEEKENKDQADEEAADRVEKEKDRQKDLYEDITALAFKFFEALNQISSISTDKQIADIERLAEENISAIDERTQALLESLGIAEESQVESLERQLQEAIKEGDAETADELRQQIQRENIISAAEEEKNKIKEDADAEARKLQRKQAVRDKALTVFRIALDTSSAIMGFLAEPGGYPGIGLSIGAGIQGTAAAIAALAEPLPALASGGIILPRPGGTPALLAENGSSELALNAGQSGQALLGEFAQQIADRIGGNTGGIINAVFIMDGEEVAKGSARYYNDGVVEINLS